jgi:hypothetical protein
MGEIISNGEIGWHKHNRFGFHSGWNHKKVSKLHSNRRHNKILL